MALGLAACTPWSSGERAGDAGSPDEARYVAYRLERERARNQQASTPEFMALLGLRAGMTVVDIGAGTGQLAADMAAELARLQAASGSSPVAPEANVVFATDTDAPMIREIEREARERGLANLRPVQVAYDGVDPFYLTRTFDLMVMTNLRILSRPPREYFESLRGRLAPGGRMIIRNPTPRPRFPDFAREDFVDVAGFLRAYAAEPPDSPFAQALSEKAREGLRRLGNGTDDEAVAQAVITDINRALDDPMFAKAFVRGGKFIDEEFSSPTAAAYAEHLLMTVLYHDVYGETAADSARRKAQIFDHYALRLNNRLFVRRFGAFLLPDWSSPTWVGKPHGESAQGKKRAREALERAGWTVKGELMVPYHYVWVLEPT